VTVLPIASNLPSAMYTPLVLVLVGYAGLSILASRARANDDRAKADRFGGIAFALVLAAAVYAAVLLVSAAVSYPSRMYDMLIIIVMIGVFFAILLFLFFLLAEVIPHALRRGRND